VFLNEHFRVSKIYEGVSKSFRTGRLEWGLQMVQFSATRCSCLFRYRLSPETFWCTLVHCNAVAVRVVEYSEHWTDYSLTNIFSFCDCKAVW